MNVTFNPNAAAHNPNARPPRVQDTSTTTAPEGTDDGVVIALSQAAKQALKAGASEYTGNSPAQQARLALAAGEFAFAESGDAPNTPFGQIVKAFAPGHNKGTGVAEGSEVADGGESTVVAEGPDAAAGTDDPTLVVDEPDVAEVLDEPAPAEGETAEPESGIAGSGDAVSSVGDDAAGDNALGDEATPVGPGEPVTVVDTGDVTDELLDQLDEGVEGIV